MTKKKEKDKVALQESNKKEQEAKKAAEDNNNNKNEVRELITNKKFIIDKAVTIDDTAQLPKPVNPVYIDLTINSITLIKDEYKYYAIINVTYHFKDENEVGSINFLDWELNHTKGHYDAETNLQNSLVKGCESTDTSNLNCTSEYLKYFYVGKLYSNQKFTMRVGNLEFSFQDNN